jgi:hypothetical protein
MCHPPHACAGEGSSATRIPLNKTPDTPSHPAALPRPSLCINIVPRKSEGAGNAGRSDRTRSFVCRKTHVVTTGEPSEAGIPCANGFNGFLRGLPGDRAFLPPSPRNAKHCRELIPASRYQDATTSPSASCLRSSFASQSVHRSPRPTFVTIAKRPSLVGTGCAEFCF